MTGNPHARKTRMPAKTEEAEIQSQIDPDNPEWTAEDFKKARPVAEVHREVRRRGKQNAPPKVPVSIRLDQDVVDALKAQGRGWQSKANQMLRDALENR